MIDTQSAAADDAAIRNLCHQFSACVLSRDAAAFRACWAEDGVWDIGAPMSVHLEGADKIADGFTRLMQSWEFFVQMPHGGVVRIDGDRATATWIMNEVGHAVGSPKGHFNYSTYTDALVKQSGAWKFTRRDYRFLYLDETPLAGQALAGAA